MTLYDCGTVRLDVGQQIAFTTSDTFSYRLSRQEWGYVVATSLNDVAKLNGYHVVIAGESLSKAHLMFVKNVASDEFNEYRTHDGINIFVDFSRPSDGVVKNQSLDLLKMAAPIPHKIALNHDEQVTLVSDTGTELDVVRKTWGFYGTPSFGFRMPRFNLRPALITSGGNARYFVVVERGHEAEFRQALEICDVKNHAWLDDSDEILTLAT